MVAEPSAAHVLVRLWLPDRPGALGLVASRIGAVRGDIVGIDVLERGDTVAVDEFAVVLPDREHIAMLVREITEVDGVTVEEIREIEQFPDPRLDALASVTRLTEAGTRRELEARLAHDVRREFLADWAAVVADGAILSASGSGVPEAGVLTALAAGIAASPMTASGATGPEDLSAAPLPGLGWSLLVGRAGHPFRTRERLQLLALARIADRVAQLLDP